MTYTYRTALFLLPYLLMVEAAQAQTPAQLGSPNDGTGYLGAALFVNSEYLGSDDEDVRILPYLSLQNVKGFDLFGTTLSYRAIEAGTGQGLGQWSLRAGPSLSYQGGRDSDDSPTLNGFDDVDGSLPLGGYIRATVGPIGFGVNAGQDIIGGHDGFTADASIGTFLPLGALKIQPSMAINWADNAHNDSFFSVNPEQASASGLNTYDAGSGIYSYSANVVSWVEIEDKYAVSLIGSYRWFTADASDSPILNAPDGSKTGFFLSLGVSRKFDTSKW